MYVRWAVYRVQQVNVLGYCGAWTAGNPCTEEWYGTDANRRSEVEFFTKQI